MTGPKLYLAGPLFTESERLWNRQLARHLRAAGFDPFVPQEGEPIEAGPVSIFEHDMSGLRSAQAVVANLDGPMVDDGTAWEMGWAFGQRKPIIGYRTDSRNGNARDAVNLMLTCSCRTIVDVQVRDTPWESIFNGIVRALHALNLTSPVMAE